MDGFDDSLLENIWNDSDPGLSTNIHHDQHEPQLLQNLGGSEEQVNAATGSSTLQSNMLILPPRKPLPVHPLDFITVFEDYLDPPLDPQLQEKQTLTIVFLAAALYGKRQIQKIAQDVSELDPMHAAIYHNIRAELDMYPGRRERIFGFINRKDITARLMNYFTVIYTLINQPLDYYVDRSCYPFKIVGEFNKPNQPEVLKRIAAGEPIVRINLHQNYKQSKMRQGCKNLHAPYRRGPLVQGEDGFQYSLCELNFWIWFDSVCGIDAFFAFEQDVRNAKAAHNASLREDMRQLQHTMHRTRKRKTVLSETDGQAHKTFCVQYAMPAPYIPELGGAIVID